MSRQYCISTRYSPVDDMTTFLSVRRLTAYLPVIVALWVELAEK